MLRIFFSLIILFSNFNFANAEDFKLTKILEDLNSPWSLSFVSQNEVLITEKPGNIIYVNIENKKQKKVEAKPGDLFYFPKGTAVTFTTSSFGLGFFCGQRGEGEA